MFRPISGSLGKKKDLLIKANDKGLKIIRVFGKFLSDNFEGLKCEIGYDPSNGKAVINTGSKVLANEVSLKLMVLVNLLKKENIKLTQIVIR